METLNNYNDHLPAGYQDIDDEDPRVELYNQYGNHVYESLEDFCDRMANRYGVNWISTLSR